MDVQPGTGLGLSICRGLVEAMGGTIVAQSSGGPARAPDRHSPARGGTTGSAREER